MLLDRCMHKRGFALARRCLVLLVAALLSGLALAPSRGQAASRQGRIQDASGNPVSQAKLELIYADGSTARYRSDATGTFLLRPDAKLPAHLRVTAPGYASMETTVDDSTGDPIRITLQLRRFADTVTVTASRLQTPESRSIQNVISLAREDREMRPSLKLDDTLRSIPGFTLFRRSSSLVAHPTSQGVSLRGIGPSGASRSLVLADGVPLTDPFGGWVYWGRLPSPGIDRVEVLRGGASELYGSNALGGVIQLFRRLPTSRSLALQASGGNLGTGDFSLYASHRKGRQGMALASEYFHTDGFIQVSPAERGEVDTKAKSEHHAVEATWDYRMNAADRFYIIASEFSERRGNGTRLQKNDTQIRSLAAGSRFTSGAGNLWEFQAFTLSETFNSLFSAISRDRSAERLTRSQRVPASSFGFQGLWRRLFRQRHLLLIGGDYSRVLGASDELGFRNGAAASSRRTEGRQDRAGLYVQDLIDVTPRFQLLLGARWDGWKNHKAFSFSKTFSSGAAAQAAFPSRGDSALSPKVGGWFKAWDRVSLRGSLSRSFRAPTLNELYRSFRVGNTVTAENPDLGPERATTGEFGVDWGLGSPVALRSTFFWSRIRGTVANVTLGSSGSLISRQRQNLGATRSRGIELDFVYRPDAEWKLSAGYFYSDSTVRNASQAVELIGLRVPQVPRHQGVIQAAYRREGNLFASMQIRLVGGQFDDDRNRFLLGSYQVVDLSFGKRLNPWLELFVAGENIFDRIYAVGRTPVERIGTPRLIHAGIRLRVEP